jgi:MFS family permease
VGTGAGMLIFPLVAHALISDLGWRSAYLVLGALAMVVMVGFAWFMRRDPRSMGLFPDGVPVTPASRTALAGADFSLKQARRTRQFYMLCAVNMLTYFCTTTIIIHIDPHAQDIGISATQAATLLAAIGGVSIVGRLIMGSFGDRLGEKRGLGLCLIIFAVALTSLQFLGQLWMLYLFACVYGFAHGGFFALLSPTIAELFGMRAHGIIYGFVIFSGTIGSAIGPLLAGSIFDATGSYRWAFISLTIVSLTAMALTLLLKPTVARPSAR